ncbi:hypothetical protein FEM48_Zijuj01G0191100 [Ziziphus jujuba var. spinosa]|uniref:Uncharacterized protein n=1 Tax=Ziziphus jujuba var. spinosa TaxID=714518 RepID=A0A978W313_ZIZJJ|nr:hypothetical protein FEM48_Zijuj01G0191100 [Ziziphus jujuba var. spinosa]
MLAMEEHRRKFHGIKVVPIAPLVTHLLFVDDIILVGRANVQESARLLDCIRRAADFNLAFLAKLGWTMAANIEKIWVKMLKAKYCRLDSFLHYPWVPKLTDFRPSPRARGIDDIPLMADNLKSQDGLSWNVDLVKEIFEEESAKAILGIHWARSYLEDRIIWLDSKKGNFSVKSAYLEINASKFNLDQSKVWKLLCDYVKRLWFGSKWCLRLDQVEFSSFVDYLNFILKSVYNSLKMEKKKEFTLFGALIIEFVWRKRNQFVFKNETLDPTHDINTLNSRAKELFVAAGPVQKLAPRAQVSSNANWKPPQHDFIKLNFDASIKQDVSAIGLVARDHWGNAIKMWSKKSSSLNVDLAKCIALEWAIDLATSQG